MCHILLGLPLLALPLLWMLPLRFGLPLFVLSSIVAVVVYWYAVKAMHRPVLNGMPGMVGERGTVAQADGDSMLVRIHGEIWPATVHGAIPSPGDAIEVVGFNRTTLKIRKAER